MAVECRVLRGLFRMAIQGPDPDPRRSALKVPGARTRREALAAAVRRSFAGFGIDGNDDAEFVSNAMRWYTKEKGGLIVNREYYRNENMGLGIETYQSASRVL